MSGRMLQLITSFDATLTGSTSPPIQSSSLRSCHFGQLLPNQLRNPPRLRSTFWTRMLRRQLTLKLIRQAPKFNCPRLMTLKLGLKSSKRGLQIMLFWMHSKWRWNQTWRTKSRRPKMPGIHLRRSVSLKGEPTHRQILSIRTLLLRFSRLPFTPLKKLHPKNPK